MGKSNFQPRFSLVIPPELWKDEHKMKQEISNTKLQTEAVMFPPVPAAPGDVSAHDSVFPL